MTRDYKPWQKLINLTMDEMYICEGVVYDKHAGQMIGFTDISEVPYVQIYGKS